jgi:hypothetical protein
MIYVKQYRVLSTILDGDRILLWEVCKPTRFVVGDNIGLNNSLWETDIGLFNVVFGRYWPDQNVTKPYLKKPIGPLGAKAARP